MSGAPTFLCQALFDKIVKYITFPLERERESLSLVLSVTIEEYNRGDVINRENQLSYATHRMYYMP